MCDQGQYKKVDYELERDARIAENKKRMEELGVMAAADAFKQGV
jgi:hypothetical protein